MKRFQSVFNATRVFKLLLVAGSLFVILAYQNSKKNTGRLSEIPAGTWGDEDPMILGPSGRFHRLPTDGLVQHLGGSEDHGSRDQGRKADGQFLLDQEPTVAHFKNYSYSMLDNHNATPTSYVEELKQTIDHMRNEQEALDHMIAEVYSQNGRQANTSARETLEQLTKADLVLQQFKQGYGAKDSSLNVHSESVALFPKDVKRRPVLIVIVARMRTGSSMLGEIFNQNPTLLYLYEPLISIDFAIHGGWVQPVEHRGIGTNIFGEYSQCRFPKLPTRAWLAWKGSITKSAKLLSTCTKEQLNKTKNGWYECSKNITINNMEALCRAVHGRIAIKTIRSDLDYLKPLVEAGVNVKIIHLVRDPRGTTNSRKMYYSLSRPRLPLRKEPAGIIKGKLDSLGLLGNYPDHMIHTIPRLCQWTRDSILQVRRKPAWLRGRYKLVRYEDFAADPLHMTRDIYDFLGLDYPVEVKRWLVTNTQDADDDRTAMKPFSTHKNSALTASRWRLQLQFRQVRQVEKICEQAMALLGYRKVPGAESLANESVSLTRPLPMDDTL